MWEQMGLEGDIYTFVYVIHTHIYVIHKWRLNGISIPLYRSLDSSIIWYSVKNRTAAFFISIQLLSNNMLDIRYNCLFLVFLIKKFLLFLGPLEIRNFSSTLVVVFFTVFLDYAHFCIYLFWYLLYRVRTIIGLLVRTLEIISIYLTQEIL